ncbi:MAG: hypothetical protein ABIJ43_01380 [Candidatus Beckwithbacteria bacterium]|nr:hypothetical protein [Patescibacteria group bacterium]
MNNLPDDNKKKKKKTDLISVSGLSKERLDKSLENTRGKSFEGTQDKQEVTPMTEFTRKVDLEPEVEGWLEKIEKEDSQLQQSVTDPSINSGQAILDDAQPSKFKVILPLTKEEVDKGLHSKVIDSVRWLAEWCLKTIKMFHGKVAYKIS